MKRKLPREWHVYANTCICEAKANVQARKLLSRANAKKDSALRSEAMGLLSRSRKCFLDAALEETILRKASYTGVSV